MEPIVLGPSVPDLDPTLGGPNRPNRVHRPAPSNPRRSPRADDLRHATRNLLRLAGTSDAPALISLRGRAVTPSPSRHWSGSQATQDRREIALRRGASGVGGLPHG